ncbi:MAG: hypothetical protein LQ340_002893 [Diploschistes diacapsis]|nr:MAG: hypothetical protein LQ340_002893 [Diploschistes diacapsis]
MSAEADDTLTKVDSAVGGVGGSPTADKKGHRRASSSATGVWNVADLEKEGKELKIAKETQKLNWSVFFPTKLYETLAYINAVWADEKDVMKKLLTDPPVKKIDLHFPLGLEVTARNLKGVTIKDALDAIYKQYKKKATGFEWDKEESWTRLVVHQKKEGAPTSAKKKKNKGEEE